MPVHSRRRKRSLRIEGLEERRVLAVNPYSLDLDAVGTVDLFAPDGGGSVQDFFVDHPLSIGGIITSRNQPGTNNRPPNVGAVSFASNEGEVLNEAAPGLLQNASDPEGTPVRVSAIASQSAFGATLFGNADGSFTYDSSTSVLLKQLKPGQTSVDTFEFVVEDADGGLTVSSASVTVSGKNTAPALSNNGGGTVSEGANSAITPQQLRFTDSDDAPNELTFTVLVAPSHGALKFSDDLATTIHSFTQQDIDVGRVLYVHNGDESGADSFQFQLADGNEDGVTPTTGTFSFTVTAVDDAPSNSGSLPASATFNEDESGALDLSSVSFSDADGGSSTIVLDADEGKFQATDGGGVTVSGADTNQIRLTGSSSDLNTFLANPNAITYTPPINATGASADTVTMTSQSDDESRVLGSFDVNITDVADPPSNSGTLPSDITVTEDAASNVDLSGVTLADPDGDSLTLTLTASGGVLAASSGGGVTTGGSGTGTLTLSGSPSDLNTFLDTPTNIQYTGPSNVSGDDAETIAVSVHDGGAPVGLGTINVDITNVADPPSNSGSLPSDITVTEDAASNVDLSGVTLTDPDGDSLTLTLTASGGVLAASSGGGVTAGGSGTGTLTLSGSPSDLNTFLDTPTNIQYTGPSNASGDDAETIAVSINDGGAPVGLGSVNVDITNVADPPSNSGSLPSDITVTEDAASDVDLSVVTLTDPDGDSLTLTLTASGGVLAASSGGGVTTGGSGTGTLTLSGSPSDLNTFLDTPTNIQYTGPSNVSGDNAETIAVSVHDGGAPVGLGSVNVDITNVADPPSNSGTLPSDITVTEDAASDVDLSGVTLTDPDGDSLTLTLTASGGVLAASSGGGVAAGGSGTGTLTLSGSPSDLNTFLDTPTNIQYTGPSNVSGDDAETIAVSVNDGGVPVGLGTINVDITNVADPPSNSGSLPSDITVTEDAASNVDLSGVTLADPDGDSLTLTLTASGGVLAASSGGGVTAGGSGTGTLTLSGSPSDLNTFLDTPTNIQYTGPSNVSGDNAETIAVSVNDGGAPVGLGSVNVDITNVADPPSNSGTLPSDITVTEDAASDVDLSGVTLTDPDGDSLTLTLTASGGVLAASSSGGVTAGGSGTGTLTLSGSASNLNAFLDTSSNVQYTGPNNVSGDDAETIAVSVNDGGVPVGLGTINVDITNVADPPSNSGSLPSDITVTEDAASDVDLSGVTLTDPDGDSLTLTLTASGGVLAASSGGGVTVGGSGTGTLTLSGSPSDLNTFLDTTTNIQYTGPSNVSGDDAETIAVSINDGGAPVGLGTINVDITNVADPPGNSGSLPSDIVATKNTPSNVPLGSVELFDADGDPLTLDLVVSSGTLNASSGGGVTVSGAGSATIQLAGTIGDLNAFLNTVTNIQYTGATDVTGDNVATMTVSVGDGNSTIGLGVVNIDVVDGSDPPSNSGTLPSQITVIEETASDVDFSAVTLTDPNGDNLTLTLTASAGILTAASVGGVTAGGSGTGVLTLSGSPASLNTYLDTTSNIQYIGPIDVVGDDVATISVTVDDGAAPVSLGSVNIDITNVADPPSNSGTLPSDITVTEDAASNVDLSGVTLADPDGDSLTLTLTASGGVLAASSSGGVTAGGSGTGTLTLSGSASNLNAFLDTSSNVQYTGPNNVSGDDAETIAVSVNDGGAPVGLGTINVDITNVADPPSNSGSLPSDITVTEDAASNVDLSGVTLADPDGDSLTLTLTASGGVLAAFSGGGVTAGGSGTGTLTLSGSASNLNAFLDTSSNVQYTGPNNVSGDDAETIAVSVNDGGAPVGLGTINVDITNVADPPSNSGSLPSDITVTEDAASNVDLSGVTLADPDGDSLTLTLTASGGVLAASSGGGVTAGGSGTGTLTLSGSPSDLNTFLDTTTNIQYTGLSDVFGDDAATVAVSVNDGGAPVGLGTINVDITNVADPPSNSGSLPSDITVTEDAASNVDLSGVTLADPDGDSLTLTLTASGGVLAASSDGGVTAGGSGTGTLTLSGSASNLNAFLDTSSNVQYTGPNNVSGDDAETIAVSVNDGGAPVGLGTINVDITNVADPPSNSGTLPSDITVTEDAASNVDLSGVTLADPDGDSLTLTLTASGGVLAASSGGGVTAGGSGTGTLTLSGSASNLNAFLDTSSNVQYTGPNNVSGDDAETIAVSVNDGGAPVGLGTINVDITNVADPPSNSGSLPSDITVTEDAASNVDLSGVTLADPDGDSLTLTLTASGGALAASSGGGVTAGGSGTGTLTLSGSPSDLNTFLDTTTNIQYTGPSNVFGDDAATVAVSVNDGGAPVGLGTINVDITNVADPPSNSGSLPSDITVTEDAASNVDLSGVTLADPDGDSLTLTLTASGGALAASSSGGVTAGGSGTGTLTLSGSPSDLNTFLDTTTNIQYTGPSNVFGDDAATVAVSVNDGGAPVGLGTINVDITNVGDPPSNSGTLPSDITVTEDAASNVDLSGVTLADPDGDSLTLTLTASGGALAASSGGGVTAGGSGTGTLTLSGSPTDLNTFLDTTTNIQYTGLSDVFGDDAATVAVSVNDGGAPVGLGTINVDITNVADPPSNTGSLPSDLAVTEDVASNVDLSAVTLTDPDGDSLTLTLTASSGILAASSGAGVTVGGSGSDTLTLAGAPADLNGFLGVATNILFTGPTNLAGDDAATLSVSVNDGGGPIVLGTLNLDISAVNDDPVNVGVFPSNLSIVEDLTSNLDLSSITILDADVGGGLLRVTLTSTNGTLTSLSSGGVTVGGSGTNVLTLVGTLADLNAFLDVTSNIQLLGDLNLAGDDADVLSVVVNDLGNTGSGGGSDISLGNINIDIAAVNDDPTNVGSLPLDLSLVTGLLGGIDLSSLEIADVDVANGLLTVTLSAVASDLFASDSGGVTVGGSGSDTLTLTGTLANLNAYLDVTTNLGLFPGLGLLGEDVDLLTVTVNDGGQSGSGGGTDVVLGLINIDVLPVAAPLVSIASEEQLNIPVVLDNPALPDHEAPLERNRSITGGLEPDNVDELFGRFGPWNDREFVPTLF